MDNKKYLQISNYKYIGKEVAILVKNFIIIYFFWIIIHVISANLYVYFCAQPNISGILYSILTTQTPHCVALRVATETGVHIINSMWSTLAVWASSKFLK